MRTICLSEVTRVSGGIVRPSWDEPDLDFDALRRAIEDILCDLDGTEGEAEAATLMQWARDQYAWRTLDSGAVTPVSPLAGMGPIVGAAMAIGTLIANWYNRP